MNVYEAVSKKLTHGYGPSARFTVDGVAIFLAPIIERALRAAYTRGSDDGYDPAMTKSEPMNPDNGVTAGVAAMMEES